MSRAVRSIGSNLGDRAAYLRSAHTGLAEWIRAASSIYTTAPWGGVEQQDFLNAVLLVDDPAATPHDWLRRGRQLEDAARRTREIHWGPRTLDVDVIAVDDVVSADPELTLPHPRARTRAFVLIPWLDVDPDAALSGTLVRELLAALDPAERAGVRRWDGEVPW